MTRRDFSILLMLGGLIVLIGAILGVSSRPTWSNIVEIVWSLCMVGYGVYTYLRPTTTTGSPYIGPTWLPLAVAAIGLTFFVVSVFSLIPFNGITGLFSTGDNTFDFFSAVLWLVMSVWMVFLYFSRQRKETK